MGSPAGVADAHATEQRIGLHLSRQPLQLSLAARDGHHPLGQHRDTGGVVPAIFQLAQPIQQNGHSLGVSDVTYDAAH
ncbi:MAG: hypothetical protein BWY76_01622 [bacterium ADurb.Bin429]|nr:MAG: hypothetical protein BWY76_01622 [bacterium ADurb.Bin429]